MSPERVAGTAAAARYAMAVSGGLLLTLACFSLLQSHFWHCCAPLLRSSWWWRERQAIARCAAKGKFESGNLGTALKPSSPARWHPREGTSSAQHPSKQHPTRSAAVSASSDISCPTEVTLNAGCGQDFPRQEIAWYQCYSQSWQRL